MGDRLKELFGADIQFVKGGAGVFEITRDGTLVFSKKAVGRFPEDGELSALG